MKEWFDVVGKGDTKAVESLLRRGVPVDTTDKIGLTALMIAAAGATSFRSASG